MAVAISAGTVINRYAVGGMHCSACPKHIEKALRNVPGVRSAQVDRTAALVTIEHDGSANLEAALHAAVADAGYTLQAPEASAVIKVPLRPLAFAVGAALALVTFYLGIITLAQGWSHAVQQLSDDRWFVAPLVAGFGLQIGLFTYLRGVHAQMATSGMATSTGTSTVAMLACCAHHLAEILPIVGLSGAALFLNAYKTELLWLGILMNIAGILYLARKIQAHRTLTCHAESQ